MKCILTIIFCLFYLSLFSQTQEELRVVAQETLYQIGLTQFISGVDQDTGTLKIYLSSESFSSSDSLSFLGYPVHFYNQPTVNSCGSISIVIRKKGGKYIVHGTFASNRVRVVNCVHATHLRYKCIIKVKGDIVITKRFRSETSYSVERIL